MEEQQVWVGIINNDNNVAYAGGWENIGIGGGCMRCCMAVVGRGLKASYVTYVESHHPLCWQQAHHRGGCLLHLLACARCLLIISSADMAKHQVESCAEESWEALEHLRGYVDASWRIAHHAWQILNGDKAGGME